MRLGRFLRTAAVVAALAAAGCDLNANVGDEDPVPSSFRLSPSGAHLGADGTHVRFRLAGGQPPYRWVVADEDLGALLGPESRDHTAIYVRADAANGVNTLRVTDARGWTARAVIVQDQAGANGD